MILSSCILGKTVSQMLTHLMAVKNDGPALKSLRCSGPYYDRDPTSDHHFHHLSCEAHKRILQTSMHVSENQGCRVLNMGSSL